MKLTVFIAALALSILGVFILAAYAQPPPILLLRLPDKTYQCQRYGKRWPALKEHATEICEDHYPCRPADIAMWESDPDGNRISSIKCEGASK